jgi:radical SAM superfamily enzyme YgiQ (UPF0313 family)
MKVLLINPSYKRDINRRYEKYYIRSGSRWPHSGVKMKRTLPHYLPFPFYLAYSASLLKEAGFDVHAIDAVALDIAEEELLGRIKNINPRIVFYEVATPTADYDLALAAKIKKICCPVIAVGGAHATTFARQIITQNEPVDFVLRGEYEYSLLELAKYIRGGACGLPPGMVFRNSTGIIDGGYPNAIEPLDKLPFPLRDIFPANDTPDPTIYWDGFSQARPAIQMQSSRGCPYRCYFCLWNQVIYNNGRPRRFSPGRVIDEAQDLTEKYMVKEFYFDDDNFTAEKEHIFSICQEILQRKLKIKWSCMGSIVNLTEETIRLMSESGCIGIKFGVESGSEKVLSSIGKPVDLEKVREVIRHCRGHGIKTQAAFIFGLLGETKDDISKTITFTRTLAADSVQMSIATPFPGTRFFDMAKKGGLLKNSGWQAYDAKASEVMRFHCLDGRRISKIRKDFFSGWLLKRLFSPSWCLSHSRVLLRTLRGLGFGFALRQLISLAVDECENG